MGSASMSRPVSLATFLPSFLSVVTLLGTAPLFTHAAHCPLPVEPHLPIPRLPAEDFSGVAQTLTALIEERIKSKGGDGNIHASIEVVTADDDPLFEYHQGDGISGDSVYRIASISKVFTVYEALLQGVNMDNTVAQYLPEFNTPEYAGVTLRSLAGHSSGITRDFPDNDLSTFMNDPFEDLLPESAPMDEPDCRQRGANPELPECEEQDYFELLTKRPLVYPPNAGVSYSNMAFNILAQCLERNSGADFPELMSRNVAGALGLRSTSYYKPEDDSVGAIPDERSKQSFDREWEWSTPGGGMYSSSHDLAHFARLILGGLRSTNDGPLNLAPHVLRNWFLPHTYTPTNAMLIGRPWEIYRRRYDDLNGGFPFTINSKAGNADMYASIMAVIPEYGFGLSILVAGDTSRMVAMNVLDAIVPEVARWVEERRVSATGNTYAGTYITEEDDYGASGEIELEVPEDGMGLRISRWIYRDVDILNHRLGRPAQAKAQSAANGRAVPLPYADASPQFDRDEDDDNDDDDDDDDDDNGDQSGVDSEDLSQDDEDDDGFDDQFESQDQDTVATDSSSPLSPVPGSPSSSSNGIEIRFYPTAPSTPDRWRYVINSDLQSGASTATNGGANTGSIADSECDHWAAIDLIYHAGQPLDLITFERSEDGRIGGLNIPSLRQKLTKSS